MKRSLSKGASPPLKPTQRPNTLDELLGSIAVDGTTNDRPFWRRQRSEWTEKHFIGDAIHGIA
jgi:hypothetical protein